MAGQPPNPMQQGGQQPQGQLPQVPPELLMTLLSHFVSGGAQQGQPMPQNGSQMPSMGDLLPQILQALMQPQQGQMGQPGQPQQGPPQGQQQGPPQGGQQQQNPMAGIMQLLQSAGLKLQ